MKTAFLTSIIFLCISYGSSMRCKKEVFGISVEMNCPGPTDDPDAVFCCGFGDDKYCCKNLIPLDDEQLDQLIDSIPQIIGILFGVIVLIIVLCIVCCCCCPFCLLAKKRSSAGAVHSPRTNEASVMQPLQQQPPPPGAYPAQPGYPPQQPYPAPGYPAQPYPAQPMQGPPMGQPYPPPQPYPQPPPGDQPPAYSEKQPAFNPNYNQP